MLAKTIPSLFTVGNLFLGIVAIIFAFQGDPLYLDYAAITIIVGMVFDGLDGRVARMLNAQSEFGKQLDSLSDVITFGVAPAFVTYVVALQELNLFGIFVTAIFPICGALRLARFNIQSGTPGYFVGLPITAAGGVLATMALYHEFFSSPVYLAFGTLFLAFLMISSIKYPNFKKVGIPKATFWVTPIIVLIVVFFAMKFPEQFPKLVFLPLVLYALYGLKKNIDQHRKKWRDREEDPISLEE